MNDAFFSSLKTYPKTGKGGTDAETQCEKSIMVI
jgi:hypothetical protein